MEPQEGGAGGARRSRTTSLLVVLVALLALAVVALGAMLLRDDDDSTRLTSVDESETSTTDDRDTDGADDDGPAPGGTADAAGSGGGGGGGDVGDGDGDGDGDEGSTTSSSTTTAPEGGTQPTVDTVPPGQLDLAQPPIFGSTALTSGFVPDPFRVGITGGGPVNVSSLGGRCTGFATAAPSFSVNYTAGAFPLLRFFFVGSGDATMIVNTPTGSFVCADDSFGTVHPTIDFTSPTTGRYDVWIGTFASGAGITGDLSVTENAGNHP